MSKRQVKDRLLRFGDQVSADYQQIDHNYFRDISPLGENGAEAIRAGTSEHSLSDSHTVIDFNIFENRDGEGELISVKTGRNILRYNTEITTRYSEIIFLKNRRVIPEVLE